MRVRTHTHTDCSRNWVLILVRMEILWEEESFQFGFKRWQGWAVSKVLWEWIPNVGSKARESAEAMSYTILIWCLGSRYSSVVRVPDLCLKGHGFKSLQEWQKTFLLHSKHVKLKDPGHSAKSARHRLQLNMHAPYICLCLRWHGA